MTFNCISRIVCVNNQINLIPDCCQRTLLVSSAAADKWLVLPPYFFSFKKMSIISKNTILSISEEIDGKAKSDKSMDECGSNGSHKET